MTTPPSFTKEYHSKLYPSIQPNRPEISAKGKVVLVTGAGSGIGRETAITLAKADAKIIILCSRRTPLLGETKKQIKGLGNNSTVLVFQLDISNETSVNQVFDRATQEAGTIGIVVNSAALSTTPDPLKDVSSAEFWKSFEMNPKGGFHVSQAFPRTNSPSPSSPKTLLYFSTKVDHPLCSQSAFAAPGYCISKLSLAKLVEGLAFQNLGHLRVYMLHPGAVRTGMTDTMLAASRYPEALKNALTGDDVEVPAGFVLWLVSMHGECVPSGKLWWINWDVDELEKRVEKLENAYLLTVGMMGWPFVYILDVYMVVNNCHCMRASIRHRQMV
ncbi:NAD(P)-binding protein [Massarina eburnea CBS 473.64]|uniref:NAD(P)-binding protein n=1 Tax=Massarina eburnea CBS 473.64 TaxID=1395130 RepID=A0A6A6RM37_9PLEO|nr:NAD(P)-binding protein [Massarina eburnea CBS 473.64]